MGQEKSGEKEESQLVRADGWYNKGVQKRTPRDFRNDTLELECGHTTSAFAFSESEPRACNECIERWLLGRVSRPRLVKTRTPQKTRKKKEK
jgi:hypothetical protein